MDLIPLLQHRHAPHHLSHGRLSWMADGFAILRIASAMTLGVRAVPLPLLSRLAAPGLARQGEQPPNGDPATVAFGVTPTSA